MAPAQEGTEFVVECLWPGVSASDVESLDQRAVECAAQSASVRYLGSLWMREDEVVLCMFAGPLEAVRETALAADIPFERVLETTRSPWGKAGHGVGAFPPGPPARPGSR
jgi:hypothetical protein